MRGFTLVELLVVIAMIIIVSAIAFTSFSAGGKQLALERSSHKVAQDIRRALELTLRSEPHACFSDASGYGMRFQTSTPTSYILYADCNGTESYQSGVDFDVETISLEAGIRIKQLYREASTTSFFSVNFLPPDPKIKFTATGPPNPSTLRVELEIISDPTKTKNIIINTRGAIDID